VGVGGFGPRLFAERDHRLADRVGFDQLVKTQLQSGGQFEQFVRPRKV
jgi:hypothetical protein